jgi:hypothetical protein
LQSIFTFGAVSGQEPEHAPRRDQMPDHLRGVPQLPLCRLHSLHQKIIPNRHGTSQRHTDRPTGFSAPS